VEDDIGIGRRAPENVLCSIPRVPFCNQAEEMTDFGERLHVPPLTSEYTCTAWLVLFKDFAEKDMYENGMDCLTQSWGFT